MGFTRCDKARAHPNADRPKTERGRQSATVIEPARRNDRYLHGFHRLRHQRHGSHKPGMTPALAALTNHCVAPGLLGFDGVFTAPQTTMTFRPALFSRCMIGMGTPSPATNDEAPSSIMISTEAVRLSGLAANRSTPNGRSVSPLTLRISSRMKSGERPAIPKTPYPPALDTAATSSA